MNLQAYLSRIGITDKPSPTREQLFRLQKAHLFSVPYENLDILTGKPISLHIEDLFDKIVLQGRGGYCFELNALFAWLLRGLGFQVTDFFARFLRDENEAIPKRRHHVLKVCVPGEREAYLCDVGVGSGSPTYPICMQAGLAQPQGLSTYRLFRDDLLGWVLEEKKQGLWEKVFSFTEEPQLPQDYIAISFFCEHAPDSPFNKKPIVALRYEGGRKTLDNREFRSFSEAGVEITLAGDRQTRDRLLGEWFSLRVVGLPF